MKEIVEDLKNTLRPLIRISRIFKESRVVGWNSAILEKLPPNNKKIKVNIDGISLLIRTKSPDLNVAIENLTSEYLFLEDLLDYQYSKVIIDAGGYIGTAAIAFARIFPNATIITIEPSSENFEILSENVKPFKNIVAIHAGLANAGVKRVQLKDRGGRQWGFTTVPKPEDNINSTLIENVDAISIDDIADKFGGEIGFIKLDIEGGEKELFDSKCSSLIDVQYVFAELHDEIVSGCEEAFKEFSKDRRIVKLSGEKFLSIKR